MDNSDRILRELQRIKLFVVMAMVFFAITAGTMFWVCYQVSTELAASDVSHQMSDLLDQGKTDEIIAWSNKREKTHPMDVNVYWYRGKAYYQLQRYEEALREIQRAGQIQPDWRESHTDPLIKLLKEEIAKTASPPE